jgi:hypothetical protein
VSCNLDVVDCLGRRIILDHSNWVKHVESRRHPEVEPYHDRFAEVLAHPDVVIEASRDGQHHFYRKGLTEGRYAGRYLVLIAVNFGGVYKIATWRIMPDVDAAGTVIWPR